MKKILKEMMLDNPCRILAFGSSNTTRMFAGMHWFDCLDLAIQENYGRVHRCISTGIGGHTTKDLLARFTQDAAFYRPHLVFITIGGNDASTGVDRHVEISAFSDNLYDLQSRFAKMGTRVVFQTYYAFDIRSEDMACWEPTFNRYMQVVRDVAAATGSGLIDHLVRWVPYRDNYCQEYLELMHDPMHVNHLGNMVMGLDIARAFGLELGGEFPDFWQRSLAVQAVMDNLI